MCLSLMSSCSSLMPPSRYVCLKEAVQSTSSGFMQGRVMSCLWQVMCGQDQQYRHYDSFQQLSLNNIYNNSSLIPIYYPSLCIQNRTMNKKNSEKDESINNRQLTTQHINQNIMKKDGSNKVDITVNDKKALIDKIRKTKQNKQAKTRKLENQKGLTLQVDKYEIDLQSVLGKGSFGQVYKAHLIERPDQVFACKLISKNRLQKQLVYEQNNGKSMLQRIQSEIETHKELYQCKYIVKLFDFVKVENDGYYIFMEMCDIDLGKLVKERKFLSEVQSLDFFKQMLKGYKYLYDRGISHRDLKPQNLMLQGKHLKISDFGFVKVHSEAQVILRSAQKSLCLAQSMVGSINYIAPDILIAQKQKKKYNPYKSDVWSMGIILYKMLYGKQPYQASQTNQLLQKILKHPLHFPSEPKVSEQTVDLMKKLIDKSSNTRIAFKKLFEQLIGEDTDAKQQLKGPSSVLYSQKQRLLSFYNLLMTKISYDSAHHATLRQLGIKEYQKYSLRLMTYIHQKRLALLKSAGKDVQPEIKKQISSYNQIFYKAIKQNAEIDKATGDLVGLLQTYQKHLKQYSQFEMLHQQVQYFLLLLLLLYNLERGYVSTDYIFTVVEKQKNNKMNLKKLEELTKKNLDYK